jgi:ATP-dependent DNA helicase RecQ
VITDEIWRQAKNNLNKKYKNSNNLPSALKLIEDFEETNNRIKYKSDFRQFVHESKLEDFISAQEGLILVSTLHQTKGRELDNVFLTLSRFYDLDNEKKREIFVSITRAKQNLHILYNGSYFDKINVDNIERTADNDNYPEPDQISLQLSHNDVALGFFVFRQREINTLVSSRELSICETGCSLGNTQVLKFSSKFCEQIKKLIANGYFPTKAVVRHIVFWQDKDTKEKIKIILPDVEFSKK